MSRIKNVNLTQEQEEKIEQFRTALREAEYTRTAITTYLRAAAIYLSEGNEVTPEAISDYYAKQNVEGLTNTQRKAIYTRKAGTMRFYEMVGGGKAHPRGQKHKRTYKRECNKDCFNCVYPDCIMY